MTESQLQSKICAYLQAKGYCFSRINNAPIYDPTRKIFRSLGKYVMRGFPDIIICLEGRFIGLELKSKSGKQSPAQKLAEKKIIENGGLYYLIRNWEDFCFVFYAKNWS